MKKRILLIILIFAIIFGFFASRAFLSARSAYQSARLAYASIKLQDLESAKKHLQESQKAIKKTQSSLRVFTPLRIIPVLGWYVSDIQRATNASDAAAGSAIILSDAITPYADVLGLKGDGTFLGGTAQERLAKALETLSKVTPQIDQVGKSLTYTRDEIDKIAPWRYPNFLPGKPASKITKAKLAIDQIESLVVDTKPLLLALPEVMGQNSEKKYLILFQNDKELRPTGGFITAYAVFRVSKGVIASEGSEDIYKLDDTLLKNVPAPEPILKYLANVSSLHLRDSNLSPDYLASMRLFESLYQSTADPKAIDGIISLDTHFVLSMMEVLGPIEAYGAKFTTDQVDECACPQIIYELEKFADQPVAYEKGSRKDIIGVLMKQMMDKAFNAPKSSWPNLLGTVLKSLGEKHLILYFKDKDSQEAAERVNFAGRLYEYDGDYLSINETNFGGAKSNLYVQEKVKFVVKRGKDDNLEKKITVEYKYPRRMDNCSLERQGGLCLAGIYRDWIRIYVPNGSRITKTTGIDLTESADLGKTVFEGFFELRPEGALKMEIEYTTAQKVGNEYKLLIQKQPGVAGHTYEIEAFGKKQKAFPLTIDKELIVRF